MAVAWGLGRRRQARRRAVPGAGDARASPRREVAVATAIRSGQCDDELACGVVEASMQGEVRRGQAMRGGARQYGSGPWRWQLDAAASAALGATKQPHRQPCGDRGSCTAAARQHHTWLPRRGISVCVARGGKAGEDEREAVRNVGGGRSASALQ